MNRSLQSVPLQHENARPSYSVRVVLDDNRTTGAGNNIAYRYIIFGEFVIAVIGNAVFLALSPASAYITLRYRKMTHCGKLLTRDAKRAIRCDTPIRW